MSEYAIFERIFAFITAAVVGILIWISKRQIARIDKVEDSLQEHKLHTATSYVSKVEHTKSFDLLHETDLRIEGKLDKLIAALPKTRAK